MAQSWLILFSIALEAWIAFVAWDFAARDGTSWGWGGSIESASALYEGNKDMARSRENEWQRRRG